MRDLVRIYFAAAVRNGADFPAMQSRIHSLESLGEVTTRHLARPRTAELGHANDAELFIADQALLATSHVFIGDFSHPSTGAGFMAARALGLKLPVLALFKEGQRPSAMLAGCPGVTTRFFSDERSFSAEVRAFLLPLEATCRFRAPRLFLAGPPGSGKGTLGQALSDVLGIPHLSTGALLRELVATPGGHPRAAQIDAVMKAGQLVPAELMRDLVLERLGRPDCRAFGFVLDGYPPSRADLANLTSAGLTPDLVVLLECSDAVSVQRQILRASRPTDTSDKSRERLAVYHREAPAADWFPGSVVMRVDAERPAAEVEAKVLHTVGHLFGDARHDASFFPVAPFRASDVRSTRVHFHVDAPDAEKVRQIASAIFARHPAAQGQLKIHPIEALHLGPQAASLPLYRQLPNFHGFENADHEAFITGRLGDGDDALMRTVLEVTRVHGGMAELEEYLGEWTLEADGSVTVDAEYPPLGMTFDDAAFAEQRCANRPPLELHLAFDLPRKGIALPFALPELVEKCTAAGFDNGGWFVFKKGDLAAYRSNEFATGTVEAATERLHAQARELSRILGEAGLSWPVSFSLERVHGIWTF